MPASAIWSRYCVNVGRPVAASGPSGAPTTRSLHLRAVELAVGNDLPLAALSLPQQLAAASFVALGRIVNLAGDRVEVAQRLELRDERVARDRALDLRQSRVG